MEKEKDTLQKKESKNENKVTYQIKNSNNKSSLKYSKKIFAPKTENLGFSS